MIYTHKPLPLQTEIREGALVNQKISYSIAFDEKPIDITKEIDVVWSIANSLRGTYTPDKYKNVIIPMVILRRFECALEKTKNRVLGLYKKSSDTPSLILQRESGYPFYNTSPFTLKKLLDDPDNLEINFKEYINGFSTNVRGIFTDLNFNPEIAKMSKSNRLYSVIQKFSEIDLNPETIDSIKMGYIFEDLIRRFSENADAGDHYTPREVIRLMTGILLSEGCDDILTEEGKIVTILDAACGTGGMLSTSHDFILRKNPAADVRLFGQEVNPESYAMCLADMLIKGQNIDNLKGGEEGNTLKHDCFPDQKMRLVIMNPPFGTAWGGKDAPEGQEPAVKNSAKPGGRFEHGLPASTDSQLLFMQHALNKLQSNGRAAIIANGSPLFSGSTNSGESKIRKWMLETDVVEAIISLTGQLFYNTDIGIYIFILSKQKRPERKGKVQLIDASDLWAPLKKSLGKKRREIDRESVVKIIELYSDFVETDRCRIFPVEEFLYKEYETYRPLQRSAILNQKSIDTLQQSNYFTKKLYDEDEVKTLESLNPRSQKEEKKYRKYQDNKAMIPLIIDALKLNLSNERYDDFSQFKKFIKSILKDIPGCTDSVSENISYLLSVEDKTAVLQLDRRNRPIIDKTSKDTEIIRLTDDAEAYFENEVKRYVPDVIYYCDKYADIMADTTIIGAGFPFTRYFYKPTTSKRSELIAKEISILENELNSNLRGLFE